MMTTLIKIALLFSTAILFTACGGSSNNNDTPQQFTNIYDALVQNEDFNTLVAAIDTANLDTVLSDSDGSFTLFAPTDAAFDILGEDAINALLADTDTLSNILLYHVVSGSEIDSVGALASAGTKLTMANDDDIAITLSGETLYINLSPVSGTDIFTGNGIVHTIDVVLSTPADRGEPTMNIVETAIDLGFDTLVTAVTTAGLADTLADPDTTFTVFAPTDAAFEKIAPATLTALLANTDALTAVLLQHVLIGSEVDSVSAFTLNGSSVGTGDGTGEDITIEIVDGKLLIQGSEVVVFDVYTSNGVIHAIDTVITETLQ